MLGMILKCILSIIENVPAPFRNIYIMGESKYVVNLLLLLV